MSGFHVARLDEPKTAKCPAETFWFVSLDGFFWRGVTADPREGTVEQVRALMADRPGFSPMRIAHSFLSARGAAFFRVE